MTGPWHVRREKATLMLNRTSNRGIVMATPSVEPGVGGAGYAGDKPKYAPVGQTWRDPESLEDVPLVPGMTPVENQLRWGFVQKVYGIVACQLGLTALVAAVIMFNQPVQHFVLTNTPFQIVNVLLPFIMLIPLYMYKDKHPVNLMLLGAFTASLSCTIGMACTMYQPVVVLEAVALTAAIVGGLTAYSFYATRAGKDFSFMGPMLFSSLFALVIWGFIQMFFRPGPIGQMIYALLGALIFSGYIVYDTYLLLARFSLDDWIWASVTLYLDIVNLFLYLLQIIGRMQRD